MAVLDRDNATELRGLCPKDVVAVLDAVSLARNQYRNDLVNEILGQWAKQQVHEATVIQRVLHGNPMPADGRGVTAEG